MAGTGVVDLPARTLNFRVDPQVVASLEGQGGKTDLQGLGVPVAVNGPWASPAIYPDIAGILENPQAAYEKLSKLAAGKVKLPNADALGALGTADGISGLVKGTAGGSIEDLIQADQGSPQQGVVQGLGQLLGGADQKTVPAPAAPAQSAPPVAEEPVKKKGKKKQAKAVGAASQPVSTSPARAQPAPKRLMQNLLSAF
jgi:AsmA protein